MDANSLKSKVKHGAHVMLVGMLAGANMATILLMWASCLSTYLPPAMHPRLSQAGLLFPIFLVLDISFIFIWLIVSWRWTILPLLGMASCWSYIRDYSPLNLDKELTGNNIQILSYNVAGLASVPKDIFDGNKAADYISESGADIICLQECPSGGSVYHRLTEKMDSLGYHIKKDVGMCIISRWPFIGDVVYKTEGAFGNGTLAWRIDMNGDTVLLINNHLQSNGISKEEKAEYSDALDTYDKDKMKESGKQLFSKLTKAASKREEQTDSVCQLIKKYAGHSIIVTGDMNDTPISYTYQQFSRLLKSAFRESGNGLGISFTGKGFPVRIDHIFVSEDWETDSTCIDKSIKASDHRPILTRLYRRKVQQEQVSAKIVR